MVRVLTVRACALFHYPNRTEKTYLCNETQLKTRRELNANLHRDDEIWWPHRAVEVGHAVTVGNLCKAFHLSRATDRKVFSVSVTICEVDNWYIHNHRGRIVCWTEHSEARFGCPRTLAPLIAILAYA